MKKLLIDIGNSEIKTGKADDLKFGYIKRFSYSKDSFEKDFTRNTAFLRKMKFDKAGISVLNEKYTEFMREYLISFVSDEIVFINRNSRLQFKIEYSKGLGNDRICSAAAALELTGKKNVLVIDFGTATTYTFIENKILKGGLISPGINTSLKALLEKTSLKETGLSFPPRLINNNTGDNIKAGVLYQSLYTAERVISILKKKHNDLYVIATGGYADLIANETVLINSTDKYLVLKGINCIISK